MGDVFKLLVLAAQVVAETHELLVGQFMRDVSVGIRANPVSLGVAHVRDSHS